MNTLRSRQWLATCARKVYSVTRIRVSSLIALAPVQTAISGRSFSTVS
ncbi:Uncharacterised protein [Mycobacteroides abscessus subsp. abscessus]|nr:Uncharacterised protein [Mycobacteroides abscessus subsp. abscessus]